MQAIATVTICENISRPILLELAIHLLSPFTFLGKYFLCIYSLIHIVSIIGVLVHVTVVMLFLALQDRLKI
jgi:hypothetical protein